MQRALAAPLLLLAAPLAALVASCAPAAVVGAAIIVNDEFAQNAQVAIVNEEVEFVWPATKSTISHMTDDLVEVDEDLRALRTHVDNAIVTVQVQTYDVGQTRIRVAARKYMVYNDQIARTVLDRLVRDM